MRIALCISGQPRFFKEGYASIKETFLDRYDCDIFIHSWYSDSLVGQSYDTTHNGSANKVGAVERGTPQQILDLYKPTGCIFEQPKTFNTNLSYTNENLKEGVNPNGVYSMFYSIHKANELKKQHEVESGVKYDVVLRLRFDLRFKSQIDLESFDRDTLYVLKSGNPTVYYDIFGFGSSELMNSYGDVFFEIERIWNPHKHFIGENILTDGLHIKGIQATKIDHLVDLIRA